MGVQRLMAFPQEGNIRFPPYKTHMRDRRNKITRRGNHFALNQMRPELAGNLEGLIDRHGFADIHAAISFLGRIIQLAQAEWPVPALFHASELSSATLSRRSKMLIRQSGCNCRRNTQVWRSSRLHQSGRHQRMRKDRSWWNSSWSPHYKPVSSHGSWRQAQSSRLPWFLLRRKSRLKVTRYGYTLILCHIFCPQQFSSLRERSSIA